MTGLEFEVESPRHELSEIFVSLVTTRVTVHGVGRGTTGRKKQQTKVFIMDLLACKLQWYYVEQRLNRSLSAAIATEQSCIPQMR